MMRDLIPQAETVGSMRRAIKALKIKLDQILGSEEDLDYRKIVQFFEFESDISLNHIQFIYQRVKGVYEKAKSQIEACKVGEQLGVESEPFPELEEVVRQVLEQLNGQEIESLIDGTFKLSLHPQLEYNDESKTYHWYSRIAFRRRSDEEKAA